MKTPSIQTVLIAGGVIVVGYITLRLLGGVKEASDGLGKAYDTVADDIAKNYEEWKEKPFWENAIDGYLEYSPPALLWQIGEKIFGGSDENETDDTFSH